MEVARFRLWDPAGVSIFRAKKESLPLECAPRAACHDQVTRYAGDVRVVHPRAPALFLMSL